MISQSNRIFPQAEKLDWVMVHRICGEIAVSRSIGDPIYKNFNPGQVVEEYFCWPDGHDMVKFSQQHELLLFTLTDTMEL